MVFCSRSCKVVELYKECIVDGSFIGLDSTPVAANTKLNNPKSFAKNKFCKDNHPINDPDCGLGVHSATNQQNEKRTQFYWGYKNYILVDCISGLPLFEMTTTADVADSTVASEILERTNAFLPLSECTFLADKAYDSKRIYKIVKEVYHGEAIIPLNKRNTKDPKKLPVGNILCAAGLAMSKDGKTTDGHGDLRQKFCCPYRQSKTSSCPCNHKNWNNGKKNRGCTKYVSIPDDLRLAIDRDCLTFKKLYALRSECERYNARFKASGQERLWVCSFTSAQNLNTILHIALLAMADAAIHSNRNTLFRSRKAFARAIA